MTPSVDILENKHRLAALIRQKLQDRERREALRASYIDTSIPASAVLFLMGMHRPADRPRPEPCLILNQRSQRVRQPGDLCFPGGGIMPRFDPLLAALLKLPGLPLTRWPHWSFWQRLHPESARKMAVFLATGLRESYEEMRVNPFGVTFLGPMPAERLVMFHRVIFPLVGWIGRQKRFQPNGEVAKIIHVPLRDFFIPENYTHLRLENARLPGDTTAAPARDHLCFTPHGNTGAGPLWGATFRIILTFLAVVFDYEPPDMASLPVLPVKLARNYHTGS